MCHKKKFKYSSMVDLNWNWLSVNDKFRLSHEAGFFSVANCIHIYISFISVDIFFTIGFLSLFVNYLLLNGFHAMLHLPFSILKLHRDWTSLANIQSYQACKVGSVIQKKIHDVFDKRAKLFFSSQNESARNNDNGSCLLSKERMLSQNMQTVPVRVTTKNRW